ncbi:MAG: GNAT family N-acetyltransferase [Pyrinomonadaceae bacterium]|nr:GNAT family N-acetyltransferase [Pyrinomonadaceae bacterium]
MSRIIINKASGEDVFSSLRESWQQLFAVSECAPFLSWEWLSVWFKWFGAGKTPFIIQVSRENRLIGILPLYLEEKKVLGMRLERLGFIGEAQGGADYLDLIAKPEDRAEILAAIFDFLKTETSFDVLCLENLASDSATVGFLQNVVQNEKHLRYDESKTAVCPQINLSGGWETVLNRSRRASNFKRRLKQLEKMPGFEFRSLTSPAEIGAAFERFYQLHEKRWEQNGGSELSGHPQLAAFQREAVLSLAQADLIRFDELWVEGECRASVYGLDDGKTFYYYNAGYDLDWASKSVGLVLIGISIKNAIARSNSLYDFLRGDETYKFDWANQKIELVTANLSRRTIPAIAYGTINQASRRLRYISKSVLPTNLAETIKSWKRARKRNRQLSAVEIKKSPQVL